MFKLYFLKSALFQHWTETEWVVGRQPQAQHIGLQGEWRKCCRRFQKTEYNDPQET